MRVLHIMNELRFSGAEIMLSSGAPLLIPDGGAAILATGNTVGDYAGHLERAGYEIFHIPFAKSPIFFARVFKLVRQSFDVVHIHTERAATEYALVCRLAGVRSLRTVHNEFLFDGRLRWQRTFTRKVSRLLGVKQIACSGRVGRNEKMRFNNPMVVYDNWIDASKIGGRGSAALRSQKRAALGIAEHEIVAVAVGNEAPAKNLDSLVEAVALLPEGLNLRIFHCGAASAALRDKAAALADDRLCLLGSVGNVPDYLYASDIFVSPSLFEGGQLVLMEAAIAGLYCITTKVGIAEEFEGRGNVVFIESDPVSIAKALVNAAGLNPEEREAGADSLSQYALSRFVPQVGARRYADTYRVLLRSDG